MSKTLNDLVDKIRSSNSKFKNHFGNTPYYEEQTYIEINSNLRFYSKKLIGKDSEEIGYEYSLGIYSVEEFALLLKFKQSALKKGNFDVDLIEDLSENPQKNFKVKYYCNIPTYVLESIDSSLAYLEQCHSELQSLKTIQQKIYTSNEQKNPPQN